MSHNQTILTATPNVMLSFPVISETESVGDCATEVAVGGEITSDGAIEPCPSVAQHSVQLERQYSGMTGKEFRRALRALQKKVDRLKEEHLELFEENMRLRQQWTYLEAEFIAKCTGQAFPLPVTAKRRPSIQRSSPTELMDRARRSVGQFKEALASIRKSR